MGKAVEIDEKPKSDEFVVTQQTTHATEITNGHKVNGVKVENQTIFESQVTPTSSTERRRLPQGMSLVSEIAQPNFIRGFEKMGGKKETEDGITKVAFSYGAEIEVNRTGERTLVIYPDTTEDTITPRRLSLTDAGIRKTDKQGVELVFPYDEILDRETGFRSVTLTQHTMTEQRVSRLSPDTGVKNLGRLLQNKARLKRIFR